MQITNFDAAAAWFPFSDKKDHFYLKDGRHVEVDFLDIKSIMENREHMGEISGILELRRKFVSSNLGIAYFMKKFIEPITG